MSEPTFRQRLNGPTPKFFKTVIAWCITLAAVGGAIIGAQEIMDVPPMLMQAANYFILAGIVGGAVSKTTVDRDKLKKK